MSFLCYKWGNCNVPWNLADWTWSECALVQDLIPYAPPNIPEWLRKEEDIPLPASWTAKRKKFIELLCKVQGRKGIKQTKPINENIEITTKDIQMVIQEVAGIDITIERESINYGLLPIHRQK